MTGHPKVQILLVAMAFALIGIPLAKLTAAKSQSAQSALTPSVVTKEVQTVPMLIQWRCAHVPVSLRITHEGQEIGRSEAPPGLQGEVTREIALREEGVELLIEATWPEGTPDTAVTITLQPDGLGAESRTVWSQGATLSDVFVAKWAKWAERLAQ